MDELTEFLATQYQMSPDLAARVAGNLTKNGAWEAYPGAKEVFQKTTAPAPEKAKDRTAPGPVAVPYPSLPSEKVQEYLGTTAAPPKAEPAPDPAMLKRDEDVKYLNMFFSPEAEARRKKVPQYWNSPTGKARLEEMNKRKADLDSSNEARRSLTKKVGY